MRKTTTTKARGSRQTKTQRTIPPLTDPHLGALLMYLDGASPADEQDEKYAEFADDARRLLGQGPVTSVFEGHIDRPDVGTMVLDRNQRQLERVAAKDGAESWAAEELAALKAMRKAAGATISARDEVALSVVHGCVRDAMLIGASVMYTLLRPEAFAGNQR